MVNRTFKIAMVCDCFHPNVGGVECHIFQLAECLIRRGHKVIVITHSYGNYPNMRQGVRYMARALKVYYVPWKPFYDQVIFITVLGTLPIIREILIREDIEILHGHSAFSTMAHEAMMHAKALGLHCVFTDHSLFGFADISSILTNKVLQFSLLHADKVICVSHTSKENTVLRASLDPSKVYVIPNAIDARSFLPEVATRDRERIKVVVVSRLVYRKGTDLLIAIIPPLCELFPQLDFVIAGSGPKLLNLEELRERHRLHARVQLVGPLPNHRVRELLVQGDIFLNTSLPEAFCIAIVEAASCGIPVVSTAVGGVREVLPPHLIYLAEASATELAGKLAQAIECCIAEKQTLSQQELHQRALNQHNEVASFYSWPNVAEKTEMVYEEAVLCHIPTFRARAASYYNKLGPVCGKIVAFFSLLHWMLLQFLSFVRPESTIDRVGDILFNKVK